MRRQVTATSRATSFQDICREVAWDLLGAQFRDHPAPAELGDRAEAERLVLCRIHERQLRHLGEAVWGEGR